MYRTKTTTVCADFSGTAESNEWPSRPEGVSSCWRKEFPRGQQRHSLSQPSSSDHSYLLTNSLFASVRPRGHSQTGSQHHEDWVFELLKKWYKVEPEKMQEGVCLEVGM